MAGTAVAKYDPRTQVAQTRAGLMASGEATRAEGLNAIRAFNADAYLGADALRSIFDQATTTNFMPQLRQLQARNAAKGIRGPLTGAVEGDLASGFRRDLMGTVAQYGAQRANLDISRAGQIAEIGALDRGQGISLLGTELELQLAEEQRRREERQRRRSGWGSLIGAGLGGVLGSVVPGVGTAIGAGLGARLGGAVA